MLILFETPAGYALFNADHDKLSSINDISKNLEEPASAARLIKLKAFSKFDSTAAALEAVTKLQDGSISDDLKKFLKVNLKSIDDKEKLVVFDNKLASSIAKKFEKVSLLSDSTLIMELMRGIRSQLSTLLNGVSESDLKTMSLGLSHSMSRYKLKFSPDKVDTMIIQAIALLDDLDKELNTYSMRLKEWYGWHFPELAKVLTDNVAYAKVIMLVGFRTNVSSTDFSSILPEDLEKQIKELAEVSMGTEISDMDLLNINHLAEQVISLSSYRTELFEYLKNRMAAIAPNLTALVGELVGARLIAHAGSLMNLAKHPASTVQILGAEKALFRALKTKQNTPKYGLIFHASLIGQAGGKLKGKMARILAAKSALATRVDALSDAATKGVSNGELGQSDRVKLEHRLRMLERQAASGSMGSFRGNTNTRKFEFVTSKNFNTSADVQGMKRDFKTDETPKASKTFNRDFGKMDANVNRPDKRSSDDFFAPPGEKKIRQDSHAEAVIKEEKKSVEESVKEKKIKLDESVKTAEKARSSEKKEDKAESRDRKEEKGKSSEKKGKDASLKSSEKKEKDSEKSKTDKYGEKVKEKSSESKKDKKEKKKEKENKD